MKSSFMLYGCLIGLLAACSKAPDRDLFYFTGACDASAAVALDRDLFVVASDEDNILRVYSRFRPGPPVSQVDLSAFLRPEKENEESDLEGAAQLGDRIYWISSHGRNSKGKEQESRHRFFSTTATVTNGAAQLRAVGNFYSGLLDDMIVDPRLAAFNLHSAAELPPKSPGALNIEGLTATPEGHLLIGFRNPIPKGRALLLPLLNPAELIEGYPAKFGTPVTLDLGGLGIRSMSYWHESYLIIAGPADGEGEPQLFRWSPGHEPKLVPAPQLRGLNPEAIAYSPGATDFLLISDDGTATVGGHDCKKLKAPAQRRFRALAFSL
ncbi:MAG TPA: DUF3616 domain-containing protein [Verrucomicrobiae bacterium]|nr:DUF3616 domain-containing protein [Verrucomicrobiae bacterium]